MKLTDSMDKWKELSKKCDGSTSKIYSHFLYEMSDAEKEVFSECEL